ncbi:MAG: 2-(3-amino-3-carboxypropyl)histidine synthase subunit 1/2 [Candidatus Altiarchaeota archaeon]
MKRMKILHVPCYYHKSVLPVLEKNFSVLSKYDKIGLVSTAQHLNQLESIKKFIESKGKKVFVGGQILGCSQENILKIEKEVDVFLYVGSGVFHPTGISVKTEKPVVILNPYSETMEELPSSERERWLRRQKGRLLKALAADIYGVLISTKAGQFDLKKALEARKLLKDKGKKVFLFAGEELSPSNLLPFKVDCWVNTACPRLVDDHFEKPMIDVTELYLT